MVDMYYSNIVEILRCNICSQSIKETELEEHICSHDHRKKMKILMDDLELRNKKENDNFVESVINNWKKLE